MRAAIAGLLFALSGCQPAAPPNQQALPAPAVIATPAVQRTVQAEAQNADAQLARGLELLRQNNIPQARVDEPKAAAASAHATVAQAQAALNGARLDLGYTQITAPIAGWIGLVAVSVGNLVGPASGVLATIVSKDPIYVQFPITQRDLLNARREIKAKGGDPRQVQVQVRLPDGTLYEPLGHLDFVDVTTDRTTDSVTLRAGFPNPDGVLVDGQYVGVVVKSSIPEWAILIPRMALQVDQQGNYVLIVDAEGRAQVRRVVTGQTQGREVAIIQGLQAGELVIIEGAQAVRPGQAVRAQPPEALGSRGGA
ncbi:efflux RND transporter periplasmic adaptor subunit [Caldichromatium japonicum]|nr:efflux RND transporter periplasmic adaptor subunit [Caldichromatium japonicum]